ncbi:Scr1 family TA system antitoxin-like transcriptional regulator [Actinosynnema sp. NPDC004786]
MPHNPPSRGRSLGRKLREHREAAGLTVEELAAKARLSPARLRDIEGGSPSPLPPDVHRPWGEEATALLGRLCRTADRIDTFAPFGLPPLDGVDAGRCTAYVPEGAPVTGADVTVRVIPGDVGAGVERPVTIFHLPGGSSVVFYAYPHEAFLTEAWDEVEAVRAIFDRLHGLSSAVAA